MAYSKQHDSEFWKATFGSPEGVAHWRFYAYEYLDDLSFMPLARTVFGDWADGLAIIASVEEKFRALGWEGDGEMQLMWLPPFVGGGPHNHFGCYALHVKQENDGISWIACPHVLPFHRLFQPDDASFETPGTDTVTRAARRRGNVRWLDDYFRDTSRDG